MMLLALMLVAGAEVPPPLSVLPQQALPSRGCAAYLFLKGDAPAFVAMAGADPARLRLSLDGTVTDVARTGQSGAVGFGFAGVTEYGGGDVTAVLEMTIETRADVKDGAVVSAATLRIDRAGADGVVMPLAGIIACAA